MAGNIQFLMQRQGAVPDRVESQVGGHQLGQGSRLHARIAVLVHQYLVAVVVVQQV